MHVIFFFIILFTSVNGNCKFQTSDSTNFEDKLKAQGIYGRTFKLSHKTSTYYIGICEAPKDLKNDDGVIQQENNQTYVLGQLNQANIVGGDGWMLLTYENGTSYSPACNNKTRSVSIMFVCGDNTNQSKVLQEHTTGDSICNYVFEFQGYGMCRVVIPSAEKKNMSGGTIFLIIFLSLASAYLIGGFFYMRIKLGARGIDQIPNLEFWRRLGHLAADGCDYCCRCNRNTPRAGYYDESNSDMRGDDDILAP